MRPAGTRDDTHDDTHVPHRDRFRRKRRTDAPTDAYHEDSEMRGEMYTPEDGRFKDRDQWYLVSPTPWSPAAFDRRLMQGDDGDRETRDDDEPPDQASHRVLRSRLTSPGRARRLRMVNRRPRPRMHPMTHRYNCDMTHPHASETAAAWPPMAQVHTQVGAPTAEFPEVPSGLLSTTRGSVLERPTKRPGVKGRRRFAPPVGF